MIGGGTSNDRRALEREALRNVINQWNANRLDLFELSEPNEELEFHGVMRFYFQDSGQKVATKCIRVASDATVEDVIGTLVEKFRPDMRMLSVPSYALYELHEGCPERKMSPDEKPLLVQLNWHVDDREGRFLLKNVDDKTIGSMGSLDSNASFRRKLSKREKKQLKKQEKLSRMKSDYGNLNGGQDNVTEKLYTELPETSFTRSISNPEAVMRRRRQQKLEKKLQQFRSKDGGPDTGGTLKIYGEALCKDVPYKTLLLSVRDCAGAVVREMLDKYGLTKDPSQYCLVQVTQQPGIPDTEYVLDDDECPLSILMTAPNTGSIMFHVRRRPADCAPRKRKKKPGALSGGVRGDQRGDVPLLVELGPDGQAPNLGDANKTIRLVNDVMEVGSANGIALQLYGPHIQPRHCVITNADGVTSLTPCHADAHTYVNGQRIHQTTILGHGSLVKFGNSNTYRFLDPSQEERTRHPLGNNDNQSRIYESRSPRALSPTQATGSRENIETTFDIDGNVETVSTHSGAREDNRSLGSDSRSENRLSGMDRYPRGQDPILPAVLEFPEDPQEQFLARVVTHLDVTTPTFRLAPAYTLYLCARYRASTHYRPELTPTERAHKLTLLLQHAAMLIRHTVQDRSTESTSQAFWLANASELLHFLKSDRHVSAFSLQAQDTLADAVQLAFKNLVACLTDELNSAMTYLMSVTGDDHPREVINILSGAMNLLRKCRVNAALTIQLFSQLFHWISAKALTNVISNSILCSRNFGNKLANRLRNLQAWAESQGLELAAECHLAKIVQCAHLLQSTKYTPEDLANLSAACFKLNSMQLGALLMQYKAEPGEKIASPSLLEQASKAAESVADELARAEGREVTLYEDPAPPLQLLLPDDGFSCDVVQGVPPGLADFLHPLQIAGLCRLAAQPTSSGHWTVYMNAPRPPSALSTTQPEVQVIRLHKAGGGMGLSIVAAKGAGQERLGIYIKSVVPGGAADRDGRLAAGDQLLSVDGQSLLGITQEKAAEFLVRTGTVVTLEVAKGGAVYHGLATLLQQPSPTPHRALVKDANYFDQYNYYNYKSPIGSNESLYSNPGNMYSNTGNVHSNPGNVYSNTANVYSNPGNVYSHPGNVYPNPGNKMYTPPIYKPKNNIFFSSDDSLFKTEKRKLVIPRIEIQSDEPIFNLQVTDFSEPKPINVTLSYDESGQGMKTEKIEEYLVKPKSKVQEFAQNKSFSIDHNRSWGGDINEISETDKFLSIATRKLKLARQRATSTSLIDLSSSTSSINSYIYESNLDLSLIDPDTPLKHWRSPFEIRHAKDLERDTKATSEPALNKKKYTVSSRSKSVSEENLNDKLTEYERLEILKLLHDWSLHGSESKTEFHMKLARVKSTENISNVGRDDDVFREYTQKYCSEPDLSPKNRQKFEEGEENPILLGKYSSESKISSIILEDDFLHKCQYRNCIFNVDFTPKRGTNYTSNEDLSTTEKTSPIKLKSILKNSREKLEELRRNFEEITVEKTGSNESLKENSNNEFLNNITNLQQKTVRPKNFGSRRYSEIIETNKPINSDLIRCDSLERLTQMRKPKKFPESYIVSRKGSARAQKLKNNETGQRPKVIVLRKRCVPKTWKSCPDIKPKKPVKKCCKYAQKTCPILKNSSDSPRKTRKTKSCVCISEEDGLDTAGCSYNLKTGVIQENSSHCCNRHKTHSRVYFAKDNINEGSETEDDDLENPKTFQDNFSNEECCCSSNNVLKSAGASSNTSHGHGKSLSRKYLPSSGSIDASFCPHLSNSQRPYSRAIFRQSTIPESFLYDPITTQRILDNCSIQDPFTISTVSENRNTVSVNEDDVCFGGQHASARLAAGITPILSGSAYLVHRPRRMSERDLPSRVDSERTIPSSKSVPALHQIHSPTQEQPRVPANQPNNFLADGYSRTSSNNSINTNNVPGSAQNGPVGPAGIRSRSTHNLNQQDGGFYQNLSVYRNKVPSPQQLGDRTSALRSSQNSLQSSITSPPNSQRPSSAYYPTNQVPNFTRPNLHQSIPNLKSPPSMHRLQQEENGRLTGSYPNVGGPGPQQYYGQQVPQAQQQQQQPYLRQSNQQNYPAGMTEDINRDPTSRSQYGSPYSNQAQSYPSPTHSSTPNYAQANNVPTSYPMVNNGPNGHSQVNSAQAMQLPLHMNVNSNMQPNMTTVASNNGQRLDEKIDRLEQRGYATPNTGLLREDVFRQSQGARTDEIMRYPSTNNVRISEAQIQSSRGSEELNRHQEIRNSKSEDILKHHHPGEMLRYASSGNIRAHDANQTLRQNPDYLHQHRLSNEERILRGQAKLAEMGEEVRRRQQQQQSQARLLNQMPPNPYYQQQQQQQHYYNNQMAQSMQNLSINPTYQNQQQHPAAAGVYNQQFPPNSGYQPTPTSTGFYQSHGPTSPTYRPQIAVQKQTNKKPESPPNLPPTNTHPLYSPGGPQDPSTTYTASNQDPPKMAFYSATPPTSNSKPPRDPWAREEQERQQEARREVSRQWQEQQIRELMSLPYRSPQQEEQLRVLQLEREFQRRAQEAAGEDDDDTEKESPTLHMPQPVSSQTVVSSVPSSTVSSRQEAAQPPPTSILKPGGPNVQASPPTTNNNVRESHIIQNHRQPSPTEIAAPPPPERGSSFAVMSMRVKDAVGKRVSFDTPSAANSIQQPPNTLPIEENVREDPNSFIRQAESMLASPTTPTDPSLDVATATPGVIGAQEVYRDPRARRLLEQQKKSLNEATPVPEKLSFKEKMKMFAMETGEQETPKDKSKISRAQRDIDSIGSPPTSGMVH